MPPEPTRLSAGIRADDWDPLLHRLHQGGALYIHASICPSSCRPLAEFKGSKGKNTGTFRDSLNQKCKVRMRK